MGKLQLCACSEHKTTWIQIAFSVFCLGKKTVSNKLLALSDTTFMQNFIIFWYVSPVRFGISVKFI
jgi:hypothetical protein